MTISQPEGFLALPKSVKGERVLVLHAWWGLNETIKSFCKRLANSGFITFAPDLYHGKIADTIQGAQALGRALDEKHLQAEAEIKHAVQFLNERNGNEGHGVTVIGFSLGAYYALDLAATDPDHVHSVVLFYGTGEGDFSASKADYLGHFADNDQYEPKSGVDMLERSLKDYGFQVTFHHYPNTGHWFFEPDRTDAYNKEAANLAWDRTLAFLKRPLHV